MFVRCSIDNEKYPRDFAIGKVKAVDEFSELAEVEFNDITGVGVFYPRPENKQYNIKTVSHCKIRIGATIEYKSKKYVIKACKLNKDNGMYCYYMQSEEGTIEYAPENLLSCSYNDGYVHPIEQLKHYEFQNPMWFCGRSVVSKTMHIINNSLYGFNEIAGCKIYLKTHQLRTVMRCLQDGICRNMIADEVGMGKTIEALAVLKVFLKDNHNTKVLIIVPDALVEQWRTELAYKFKILEGEDINGNEICLSGMSEINSLFYDYDFVIADEVHKYLENDKNYRALLSLSNRTKNILMLSATPVQRRKDEYKKLLQLIQPAKYTLMSDEKFSELLELQGDVVRRVHESLENLDSYLEELEDSDNERTDDTEDAFNDVIDSLKKINKLVEDDTFKEMYQKIDYDLEDFGIEQIQSSLAYVCENYQFEKSIIRNRRSNDEDSNVRELVEVPYDMQTNFNNTEYNIYKELALWIETQNIDYNAFVSNYKHIIAAFFSSAAAFEASVNKGTVDVPDEILQMARKWKKEEIDNCKKITAYMEDPTDYLSRINNIIDYIDQEANGKKVLVFTNYDETFQLYKNVFLSYFGKEHCAFFSKGLDTDERELSAYRFETDEECWILLSDESGGEGRNFQNADVLLHIDIPWSANELEQRIGRLDRIGRVQGKPVLSVVCYSKETLEEDLYKFWNEGIGIFTKSQSGLEIIMNSMDEKIIKAVCDDFKYGLTNIIEEVEKELQELKEIVKRERYFDVAEYKYQTINRIMDDTRELFVANEKRLFADSMMRWSALSGFQGKYQGDATIRFDASSFSLKSAYNSLFVPPDIRLMISDRINQLQNRVRVLNGDKVVHTDVNYVQGTFDRQIALDNDYIHFFAPGDAIFDSIVNNAINSYKGTCAAFACKTDMDWSGFVFTWAVYPDETGLLERGISIHLIDKYRGFIPIEQFQCAVSITDNCETPEDEVLRMFNYLMSSEQVDRKNFQHLGSRSGSNIGSFMDMYSYEKWNQLTNYGYRKASESVKMKIGAKLKKQLALLKVELLKNSGARKATSSFYKNDGNTDDENTDLIFKCFSRPRMVLDSVCYVRMIHE